MATTRTPKDTGVGTEPAGTTSPNGTRGRVPPLVGDAIEAVLHSYEQVVANMVEFEHKAAESVRSERAKAAINLHATFVGDLTTVYVRTARAALR